MVPKSIETLPSAFIERMFNNITAKEITAPATRDIRKGAFELYSFTGEINHRLIKAGEVQDMTVEEFLSTGDLTQDQLFDKHNAVADFLPQNLLTGALRHLCQYLSARCLTVSRNHQASMFGISKSVELTTQLVQLNSKFRNDEWVDRLAWRLTRLVK